MANLWKSGVGYLEKDENTLLFAVLNMVASVEIVTWSTSLVSSVNDCDIQVVFDTFDHEKINFQGIPVIPLTLFKYE